MHSSKTLRVFSSRVTPSYLTMLGYDNRLMRSTSRISCTISSSLRPSSSIRFTATICPVFQLSARYTAPNGPRPNTITKSLKKGGIYHGKYRPPAEKVYCSQSVLVPLPPSLR